MTWQGGSSPPLEVIEGITEEQSRFFLETMVTGAPVGLAFVDRDFRYVHINEALAEINGVPREAHLGRKVKDIVPNVWPMVEQHYHQVLEHGKPALNLEISGETAKAPGIPRSWLVSYYPVHDAAGAICGVGLIVQEITERKRTDEALRASERRYRSLVEATAQTVWTLDAQGELTGPAPRWQDFTGQSDEECLGRGWLSAIHPDDRPKVLAEWTSALQRREPYHAEIRLQHRGGLYRDVIVRCVPVFDDNGAVLEWIDVAEDITARRKTERSLQVATQALQRSEERYRTFISQSTEGIWRMELTPPISVSLPEDEQVEAMFRTAYLAECNDAMARMHGLHAPTASVGRRLDQFLVRTNPRDTAWLRAFIRSGYRLEDSESREVGRDGRPRVFLSTLVGVVEGGQLVRAWGTQRDVTEQSIARAALEASQEEARRSAEQLRIITDALPALVAYIDRDERFQFCNRTYDTWFGLEQEQVLGRTVRELAGPEAYAQVKDWIRRAVRGETVTYESAHSREDGRMIYLQSTYVPSRNARGEVQGFVALVLDITDRRHAEVELEAQRSRLYDILMSVPACISILSGPQQVFTLTNPHFKRLSQNRELLGRSAAKMLRESPNPSHYEWMRHVYETGEPFSAQETPFTVGPDPEHLEKRFFNILYHPLRDADGHVESVMSFAMDVTEQVQGRRKLEEWAAHLANQEQWLRSVLDFMPVAMVLLEPGTGRVTFANRAARQMAGGSVPLGVPAQEYDRDFRFLAEDGTPVPHDQTPGARVARGERVQGESLLWETPGGCHHLLIDSAILPAAHGHPATTLLAFQDVSQLKQMQAQLEEAVRLRDEFLTVASHELRTPLTPLQLKLHALLRDSTAELPPEQLRERMRKTAESAIQQVRKLLGLISDLLEVSRLSEGRLSLILEPVDLGGITRELARRFEPQARQARCALIVDATEAVVGTWDPLRIEQVVANLLSNAIKYGPGRPVVLQVRRCSDKARLIVRDEGIGIAPESLPRIFERFERAVSPRHYGGLGLGLYITRQIIHALGGAIRVESQLQQGTTFTVELPLAGPRPLHDTAASTSGI